MHRESGFFFKHLYIEKYQNHAHMLALVLDHILPVCTTDTTRGKYDVVKLVDTCHVENYPGSIVKEMCKVCKIAFILLA